MIICVVRPFLVWHPPGPDSRFATDHLPHHPVNPANPTLWRQPDPAIWFLPLNQWPKIGEHNMIGLTTLQKPNNPLSISETNIYRDSPTQSLFLDGNKQPRRCSNPHPLPPVKVPRDVWLTDHPSNAAADQSAPWKKSHCVRSQNSEKLEYPLVI